jgi:hypothetical protein
MLLVIRGHIRDSFKTKNLYNFIKAIYNLYPEIKIFIHTWNIFANNISWRNINKNNEIVDKSIIYKYFGDLNKCIQHIIIDDDSNIELYGNLIGTINNGPMPIIGWKNYFYGKHKIIKYIYDNKEYNNMNIINFRFDLFNNSNNFNQDLILNFIKLNMNVEINKNIFLFNDEIAGIDNIYIGNSYTMYILINLFHTDLDNILIHNKDTINQEKLVYRINEKIFKN